MRDSQQFKPSRHAFTLIELMVVIVIIALLVGLLISAINASIRKSEMSLAKTRCRDAADALKAYYHDFARWPVTNFAGSSLTLEVDYSLARLLLGVNVRGKTAGVYQADLFFAGNPDFRKYLKLEQADLDGKGRFVDPWGKPIVVRLDTTGTGRVPDPFGGSEIPVDVIAWSGGPDGLWTNFNSTVNKDNIKSW